MTYTPLSLRMSSISTTLRPGYSGLDDAAEAGSDLFEMVAGEVAAVESM
jgi:hypothetical protein